MCQADRGRRCSRWAVSYTHLIKAGETTADGHLSLLTARCLGACGLAPVAVFDGNIAGKLDMAEALNRLQEMTTVATEVESVREA